jgi:hypothetical protein
MEPNEIAEFEKEMKEAGEASLTHVSFIISVLAVLVAIVTVMGHREHTEAVLMQSRSADQWNEYQARKMRVQQVSIAEDLLQLQPSSDSAAVKAKLNEYSSHAEKWQAELDSDAEHAKELEAEVGVAEKKAARYDLGEALLQIAVVLASITLLTRMQRYVIVAVLLGGAGIVISALPLFIH